MSETIIKLPTGEFELSYLKECYIDLKITRFEFKQFKPQPALIDKSGGTSRLYVGQKYDSKFIDFVPDGWDHDHCEICVAKISEEESDNNFTSGYFNGGIWVCKSCYELVLSTDNIDNRLSELSKSQK